MRHRVKGKKLSRNIKQRKALFRSLISALITHHQIKTTFSKAKSIQGLLDKLITKAKKGSLSHRRQVLAFLSNKVATHKLFDVIAPQVKGRNSGFTRVTRLGQRRGDNTQMARIQFVDSIKDALPSLKKTKAVTSKKILKSKPSLKRKK